MGGALAVKSGAPAAWNRRGTTRTRAVFREPVLRDEVAVAPDELFAARGTKGVLEILDAPGKVSGVDIAQPGLSRDRGGAQQHRRRRVGRAGHFVVPVECRYVPGDVG